MSRAAWPRSLALGALLITTGCYHPVLYEMPLIQVQRPADVATRWGSFTLAKSKDGYTYKDQLVRLVVVPSDGQFLVTLENETAFSMQFIWDQAAYVSPAGTSSPVAAGATTCILVGQSRPAETIPSHATAVLTIIPSALIERKGGCHVEPFIVGNSTALKLDGKDARLVLPLRVQDTVNEYTLVFRVRVTQGSR